MTIPSLHQPHVQTKGRPVRIPSDGGSVALATMEQPFLPTNTNDPRRNIVIRQQLEADGWDMSFLDDPVNDHLEYAVVDGQLMATPRQIPTAATRTRNEQWEQAVRNVLPNQSWNDCNHEVTLLIGASTTEGPKRQARLSASEFVNSINPSLALALRLETTPLTEEEEAHLWEAAGVRASRYATIFIRCDALGAAARAIVVYIRNEDDYWEVPIRLGNTYIQLMWASPPTDPGKDYDQIPIL